eukprot:TRINITY_DN52590_c0_g1_i1.p1 TRINITY_DN52590_c0_g1~~TRINITY_DN52590_c0_g1_i1.p1  ORF type:complete len:249 (-),score=37.71 TRINITY_DN52590_c0_g1_i1:39-785(-)
MDGGICSAEQALEASCSNCGAAFSDDSNFCRICGTARKRAPLFKIQAIDTPPSSGAKAVRFAMPSVPSQASTLPVYTQTVVAAAPVSQTVYVGQSQARWQSAAPVLIPMKESPVAQHPRPASMQASRKHQENTQVLVASSSFEGERWKTLLPVRPDVCHHDFPYHDPLRGVRWKGYGEDAYDREVSTVEDHVTPLMMLRHNAFMKDFDWCWHPDGYNSDNLRRRPPPKVKRVKEPDSIDGRNQAQVML